jgi:acyl transferase domain-containing protein
VLKIKTNIGHSEAASGLSAVIKAVLSVEKGIIPPTRGFVTPNPNSKSASSRVIFLCQAIMLTSLVNWKD